IFLYYLNLGIEAIEKNTESENLDSIYKAYEERILGIKTVEQYVNEWHLSFCLEIDDYVDISIYRESEANSISKLILECKENILDTEDYQAMDSLVRDFKIKVYAFSTADELYAQELDALKQDSIKEVQEYKMLEDYRDNEKQIIRNLLETYKSMIVDIKSKEQVLQLTQNYKINLDSIKTDKILYQEEWLKMIEDSYEELYGLIDLTDKTKEFVEWYTEYCQSVKVELESLTTKQEVNLRILSAKELLFTQGAKEGDLNSIRQYRNIVIERVEQYLDMSLYREEQQVESRVMILNWSADLREIEDYDSIIREVQSIEHQLDEIPTNEELWVAEDESFVIYMQEKYKEKLLHLPDKLFEADNLYELAKIMDFYAFYQLDGSSFERNKFRVLLNFEHKDARFVKNEVYWYCELLRSTVGLDVYFENKDYFVVEYIPYNFASINNWSVTDKLTDRKN
ncbi:MAG: hypothetical protein K2M84_01030, partial [Anaeroplasmataceae bacterium]|nr:hypothetical protein [Anaeroplasmataceae bacterium]